MMPRRGARWRDHVRQAAEAQAENAGSRWIWQGRSCEPGHWNRGRASSNYVRQNALGQVVAPARAWLTSAEEPTEPPEAGMVSLPVAAALAAPPPRWRRTDFA